MPNDERKGRRLGDETKGRIAELASGWTVDGDSSPPPDLPDKREAPAPARSARRSAKTQPPPPPGSPERKALEDKVAELNARAAMSAAEDDDAIEVAWIDSGPVHARPPHATDGAPFASGSGESPAAGRAQPQSSGRPPVVPGRAESPGRAQPFATGRAPIVGDRAESPGADRPHVRPTGLAPVVGARAESPELGRHGPACPPATPPPLRPRAAREGMPIDERSASGAGADSQAETRGVVGGRHERVALTTNATAGMIAADAPSPRLEAAMLSGQRSAHGTERAIPHKSVTGGNPVLGTQNGLGSAAEQPRAIGTLPPTPRNTPVLHAARPPVSNDDSISEALEELGLTGAAGRLAVPVGEFDHGQTLIEQDKLRAAYSHATRDEAGSPAGLTEPAPAARYAEPAVAVRYAEPAPAARYAEPALVIGPSRLAEPYSIAALQDASGSSTGRFERDEPTTTAPRGDATTLSVPDSGHAPATGTLRTMAALRRRLGLAGDMRYVATVLFGLRAAKRELAVLDARQVKRQHSRRHHQVTLGRTAVGLAESFGAGTATAEHPALGPAREQLSVIEDERSRHAGHVAAADAELAKVRREREAAAKQHIADLAALDAELEASARQLVPLTRQIAQVRRRGVNLHETLRRLDAKISAAEASLISVAGTPDPGAIQAEIARLRAERERLRNNEPAIAGELDALNPRIAGLEAARGEAQRKRVELVAAEQEDQHRVEELRIAIGAQRKVVDRAVVAAEARRDRILFQLGERLCVDRPEGLAPQLAPIDEIDVELGVADRRIMELREIQSSVDAWKLARGIGLLVLILGALATATLWSVDRWVQPII